MTRYQAPLALFGSIAVFSYAAGLSPVAVGVALLTGTAMALPGVALLRRVLPNESSALVILVFGAVLGLAVSRFGLAAVSLAVGPGPGGVIVFLLGLAALSAVLLVRTGLPTWSKEDKREGCWLAAIIAVECLTMAAAYAAVGRPTPEGFAFTPYFDRDYMNHLAVTAELARDVPPENPYFAGERLHYYWGFHLWPAAVKSLAGVTAREAMTACLPPTVALFVASLLLWGRRFLTNRTAQLIAMALGLFAFSYIGLLLLAKLAAPAIFQRLPFVSAGDFSFLSHSWYRDFLYEPHAVTALTLLLVVLSLNGDPAARGRPAAGVLVGVAFGMMLVTDAFIGVVGLFYFALANLPAFFRERRVRLPLLNAAGITLAVLGTAVALGIFPVGDRAVIAAVHPVTKVAPAYLLLELGPLFVLGVVGAALAIRRRETWPLLGLLALALAIGFTLMAPVESNIVIRKSLKVAQLPLVIFTGVALAAAFASRRRIAWNFAVAAVAAPGTATLFTDLLLYHDRVENRSPATTHVSRDERAMFNWIRTNTPRDAVVQMAYPDRIFGAGTPMLIEGLAERRTYFGNDQMPAMFRAPAVAIAARSERMKSLFTATSADDLARILREAPPLYLLLDEEASGPTEAVHELTTRGNLQVLHRIGRFAIYKANGRNADGGR